MPTLILIDFIKLIGFKHIYCWCVFFLTIFLKTASVGANLVFALELNTLANQCLRANTRFAPTPALGIITFSLSQTAMDHSRQAKTKPAKLARVGLKPNAEL
ncbi:hypothetical protein MHK_004665 [Candidatus Magnetomorum sp. HK-1]|nr:hypothetical protein MHK_004665 [Candidatus Magnetomorum sp. HK-1]